VASKSKVKSSAQLIERDAESGQVSFSLFGAGVSAGVAIGYAHLVSSARLEVVHYTIEPDRIEAEVARFDQAVARVETELTRIAANASALAEMAAFINMHRMILSDSQLSQAPRDIIRARRCNAEWALVEQTEHLAAQFDALDDVYMRERKADVQQVAERIVKALTGTARALEGPSHEENVIVVAHDLSPADMILFKQHQFAGFVTDIGGVTSHTAIVARSLNLPAIVGLHHARHMIRENELLVIDGSEGILIVNPDRHVLAEYQLKQDAYQLERQKLKRIRLTPSATIDGTPIELMANIELPDDMEAVLESGATGIGLFRSEFLFLNRNDLPDEEEQFAAYRRVAESMQGQPVVVRTLDLGADKTVNGAERSGPNPALGLRAIRFCLAEPQMFVTQLRAILRASHYGNVRLLLPMVAHAHEIDHALVLVARARAMLDQEGLPYDKSIQIGAMVEVPAAALSLPMLIKRLDFLSIGTNDLIQYTLAIDRTDDTVAHLYDPLHPAVLHLVANTIRIGARAGVPVSVCGEMAGETRLTRLLLGMGLRQFSVHPAHLLEVKQQVLRTDLGEAKSGAAKVLRASDPDRIAHLVDRLNA
jgi:phosphotransferase system enzyme I (PtsI)